MRTPGLIRLLKTTRLSLANEKRTQADLAMALEQAGIPFEREVTVAPGDIIDFMIGGIGIELKIKAPRLSIYRQCLRYCESDRVEALVLGTNTAMALPSPLAGKPTFVVYLGTAWL